MPRDLFADDAPQSGGKDLFADEAPKQPDGFQPTQYGFKVRPIDLGNGKQTVQREDGAAWFGPEQGNKGKPGWFDANGNRLGDAPGKDPAFMDRFTNDLQQKARAQAKLPLMGQIVPAPVAGMTKGLLDTGVAPAQLVAHALGSNAVDPVANAIQQNYEQNWQTSKPGEVIGQAMPFLATMGGSAAAQAPTQVLTTAQKVKAALASIAKASATGAVAAPAMTVETGVQGDGDFWVRKAAEAKTGSLVGGALGALPVAIQAASGLRSAAKVGAETPAPAEMLETIGKRFEGKTPGEAIQDAANAKYDAAWGEFKKAMGPVDTAAEGATVDYAPAITKLQEVLGVGQPRKPFNMPMERRQVLESLLADLEATKTGDVSNSFDGALDVVKRLGAEQRKLAKVHGDTEARQMLQDVRDSVLQSMQESNAFLSDKAREARQVFAREVVPLFDKAEGGNFLTQIRDSPRPGDLLVHGNQGSLARVLPGKAAIIAKGSSADPMLYSYLDHALTEATKSNNPRIFADSLKKAMPAIEAIGTPEDIKAFQGLVKVAGFSNKAGHVANLAVAGAAEKLGFHAAGGAGVAWGILKPGMSGPGFMWKLLRSDATRKLLSFAAKLPDGSPELGLITKDIMKAVPAATRATAPNVTPLRPNLPAAAGSGTTEVAQNEN